MTKEEMKDIIEENPLLQQLIDQDKLLIDRLDILWRKLDDEGHYVGANTVMLAIKRIGGEQAVKEARSTSESAIPNRATRVRLI